MNILVYVSVLVGVTFGYPTGPPDRACYNMTPGHGVDPQGSSSPYSLMMSYNEYKHEYPMTVWVEGPSFRGMMLQARKTFGGGPIGTFSTPETDGMWIKMCDWPQDTIAHNRSNVKSNPYFMWWPPKEPQGNLVFVATIVQDKAVFWTDIRSQTLYQTYPYNAEEEMWESGGQERPIAATAVLFTSLVVVLLR